MGKLPRFSLLEQARTGGRGVTSIGGSVSAAAAQFREHTRQLVDDTAVDAANLQSQIRDTLAQSIGDGITDGIAAGFERGFATGRIGEGFKSLAGTMLSGLGSAMMDATLPMVDGKRMPAYLDNSNERNIKLYERYGFRVISEYRCREDAPPIWGMWRDARLI